MLRFRGKVALQKNVAGFVAGNVGWRNFKMSVLVWLGLSNAWQVKEMEVGTIVDLLKGAKELADLARLEPPQRNNPRQQKRVRDLISTLRLIYFSPRGVLSLLETIANGGYPTEEQVEMVLTEFNDAEPFVLRARHVLDPDFDRHDQTLTLKAERVLRDISYGKGGVRAKVQSLLNWSLTYEEPVSSEDAKLLIQEIRGLNTAIEEAEEALVTALAASGGN
ncbi:hypothetical protein [uncultured Roseobacter sp.]|uniref:hypothetical protein n=1 Tax=uncultured Roseobacter sp. TaxID=114847 RepID=UPI0026165C8F|nr:hypothetical protein [uncultured Roseobacter sp.]